MFTSVDGTGYNLRKNREGSGWGHLIWETNLFHIKYFNDQTPPQFLFTLLNIFRESLQM